MTKSNASTPTNNLLDAPVLLELKLPAFDAVHITLVGCGGTGSHIATGLGALLLALGLPYSLTHNFYNQLFEEVLYLHYVF